MPAATPLVASPWHQELKYMLNCTSVQQMFGWVSVSVGKFSEQFLSSIRGFQQDAISTCICYFSWKGTL